MTSTYIFSNQREDFNTIDSRLKPYLQGWVAVQKYKGKTVEFFSDRKGTWGSEIFPYRYFEVIKTPSDDNYKQCGEEDEIVLCLWVGWPPAYDDEIDIRLHIRQSNVKSGVNKVSAEILSTGGAPITLFFRGKKVAEFNKSWWGKDKIWIDSLK